MSYARRRRHRSATKAANAIAAALLIAVTSISLSHAETLVAADRDWSDEQGWQIYWNAQNEGCFAERLQADGTLMLLGMFGKDNRLAIGFRNGKLGFAKKDKRYDLNLRFDGRDSWTNGMSHQDFGGGPFLLGVYGNAAKFRASIAKAGKLTIGLGKNHLAEVSLKGSNAAFKAVDECREAMRNGSDAPAVADKVDSAAVAEADRLGNAANKLYEAGNYAAAEPLFRRALAIHEKALGPEHASVAEDLNNLAILLKTKGDLAGSLELARRAAKAGHPQRGTY